LGERFMELACWLVRRGSTTIPGDFSMLRSSHFPGLWIRIDLIRIRIQPFCSIRIRIQNRIRIQAKTELSKTISFSNYFEIKIWVKSNQKYRCYSSNFFLKK
jgi:hypothetical protein